MLLNKTPIERFIELSEQSDFVSSLDSVYSSFKKYLTSSSWFSESYPGNSNHIAYFCLEYGINESFPNYSGGLGILAGDHLKSASDLGVPIIAVGLLYQMGYFRQQITQGGWQNESYYENDFFSMPMSLVRRANGDPIVIDVQLTTAKCYAHIWQVQVGRVSLYLLDTNVPYNSEIPQYQVITNQLYGGNSETRIQQEILLGIGGIRALRELGIHPTIIHINEGHAAFAALECARFIMQDYSLDFRTAVELTHAGLIFTTHTPVPAGNEVFPASLLDKYFDGYWQQLGLQKEEFLMLGNLDGIEKPDSFSMTILALRLSSFRNGVSELHGRVARSMWNNLWKGFPDNDVPIRHVTNGIHTLSWISEGLAELYDRYISPRWRTDTHDNSIWKKVYTIPNEELWRPGVA
jgi:starch phosphorylase